ncbi:MAG: TonB-dependent receptor [Candidatus Saganbacteria bacterium]|nr:TonB-dependent receptor [Candidatus Saganbacteria bacterium]
MFTKSKVKSQKSKVSSQKSKVFFLLLLVFLNSSFVIRHSSFAADLPTFYGQEVVVTAARLPRLSSASPWDTTVIGSAELQGYKTVGEALRTVAGADVIAYGSLGSLTTVRLRGANSSQVLVLVDGRRINSPTLGMFDTGDLLLDNVERIEVVRAPLSAVYGSDAVSGVINVITRPTRGSDKIVTALTGSFNTHQYKIELNGDNLLLAFDQLKSDGFRLNGDYLASNFYAKLAQPSPLGEFSADYNLYDAQKGVPGVPTSEADRASATEPNDRQTDRNTLASVGLKSDRYQLRVYRNNLVQRLDPYIFGASTNETAQTGLEWSQNFDLLGGNFLYGLEGREDHGRTGFSGDRTVSNLAAYVQEELPLNDRLNLTASLRGDRHSVVGKSFNPRCGLAFQAAAGLILRASAGTAFRAPTLNELYWNDGWMFGSAALKPEKSFSYELGLEKELTERTSARLNYFNSDVTDMILWETDQATYLTYARNVGRVRSEGVEFELTKRIEGGGRGFINYSYQNTVDKQDVNAANVGKQVPYTPREKYAVGVVYGGSSLIARHVGERYATADNALKLSAYTVVDLKFSRQISNAIELDLAANNLFDEKYSEVAGLDPGTYAYRNYPMPGRNISLGVTWKI